MLVLIYRLQQSPPIPRYDNRAKDLTKEGMRRGIQQAAAFLLFLSEGVLERPFCQVLRATLIHLLI
jgi:hypothetical protein